MAFPHSHPLPNNLPYRSPYPSSSSFPFRLLQTSLKSTHVFTTPLNLKTSCHQTLQTETGKPHKTPEKKQKLKPSFYDQVQEKWSVKITSQRLNFPWQEQKQAHPEEELVQQEQEEQEEETIGVSESRLGEEDAVSYPLGKRVISPPWVHRNKPHSSDKSFGDGDETKGLKEMTDKEDNQRIMWISESGVRADVVSFVGLRGEAKLVENPWERSGDGDKRKRSNTEVAEKMIPEAELRRLRNVSLRMKERIKVKSAGITQGLIDAIHEKWERDEVVKIRFEGPFNMKQMHEVLETRSGGLVIWRSGSSLVLYRGMAYKLPCVKSYTQMIQANIGTSSSGSKDSASTDVGFVRENDSANSTESLVTRSTKSSMNSSKELMNIDDLDTLLDELGPRFKDWSGREPLPVDADLLPGVVRGYAPPFRLLPHGIRRSLGNKQVTLYRRLARVSPPHFALGRNRDLQGLAMAMVKLWERNAIVKIAIKRGVQNTLNERMAEELKKLTGGTLLSRNMDYIVFYRGNDFLIPSVTEALIERKKLAELQHDEEEKARLRASALFTSDAKASKGPLVAGTLAETIAAKSRWGNQNSSKNLEKMKRDLAVAKRASLVRYLEKKLAHAQDKVNKAEKALGKIQESLKPADLPSDLETISEEERFLFRKIGLSMKPFLLVGRNGVFDGTVENMHLHWKHRELVKIIVKGKSFHQVKHIAISLEAESGGLLISVDKTTKGYEIIIYRGKNYQPPCAIRPKNLLTKRQASTRSIELQRREGLFHHISDLREQIELLKSELNQMESVKEEVDEEAES